LPIDEAVRISREIADALDEAHRHGIVHRDIKPANVMIDDRGRVKVVDFGIAKIAEPVSTNLPTATRETGTGVIVGTLKYMSPEQKSGGRVDHRSDIYSLGMVMQEMMPDPPSALRRIITKSMEKNPEQRYQSARELLHDLDAVGKRRLPLITSLAAIALIAIVAGALYLTRRAPSTPAIKPTPRVTNRAVAVLPFVNMSADTSNAFIADGMTEEIINALAQLPSLHVVSRTSSFAFKGQSVDIRTIGSKLGVTSVVEGSVQRARLAIDVPLIRHSLR
jgi:serine/threonine protein kinase